MALLDWSQCPAVESIPGRVRGAWVFKGTRIRYQQKLRGRRIALVVLMGSTKWSRVRQHADRFAMAVASATPGSYTEVEIPFEPK